VEPSAGLPSKQQVIDALKNNNELQNKRDLTRFFAIKGDLRSPFKKLIKEMQDEGLLNKKSKANRQKRPLLPAAKLPSVTVLDILPDADQDHLIATPLNWNKELGEAPKILVEVKRNDRAVPGPGEQILARIFNDSQNNYTARTMKILPKPRQAQIGIIKLENQGARLVPIDRKQKEMRIASQDLNGAKDGDLVEVETIVRGRIMVPVAKVTNIIGNPLSEGAISLIALHALEIPYRFPSKVIEAAKQASLTKNITREDWRHISFVTIDPANAKDHDDAVFAEHDKDENNRDGFLVYVAIADVASYVTSGSVLDGEAQLRGNSIYFPDRVVPMLPETISNNLCSLRQGEERPAMALKMIIDANGNKLSHSFHRVMIKVALGISYSAAQKAFDGDPDPTTAPFVQTILTPLWLAYQAMSKAREKRAPLALDLPERRIVLNDKGLVERVFVPKRMEANRLIEEMMVAANVCAAQTLENKKIPLIYRVHDVPGEEKLAILKDFLLSLEISFSTSASIKPEHFNRILNKSKGTHNSHQVSEMVLRSQAQAEYNSQNYGHFGLNLDRYAHFTSPIRRYADLIVHRALILACELGNDGLSSSEIEKLKTISEHISMTERRAMAAERQTNDRLISQFLSSKISAKFSGKISGVTHSGLFVKLDETGADGFIPAATLGRDYFTYVEAQQAMIGQNTGERFRLGDEVEVKLMETAPMAGGLRFEMLSDGQRVKPLSKHQTKRSFNGRRNTGKRNRQSGRNKRT